MAFICSMADAICMESHGGGLGVTLTKILAVMNAIFAIPLFFASVGLIFYLTCGAYLTRNYSRLPDDLGPSVDYEASSVL